MRPNGSTIPQAGCIQPAFVRYQHRLANTLVHACLRMCGLASFLRTRPPVDEEGEETGDADVVAVVRAATRDSHCCDMGLSGPESGTMAAKNTAQGRMEPWWNPTSPLIRKA